MNLLRPLIALAIASLTTNAATFSNSRASVADSSGGLSWNDTAGQKALTVSCWFKISMPNGGTISQPMVIMANTNSSWNGTTFSGNHAYALFLSPVTGNVDFCAKGTSGTFSRSVVVAPYLERWYHVAVVISNTSVTGYVDGRRVFIDGTTAGNTTTTDGIHIGGNPQGYSFPGEIQEVQVFQSALSQTQIASNRFLDLNPASWTSLKGYFKLAYSTTASDQLNNFAATPPTGTNTLSTSGTVTFEETTRDGEQSLFDSQKNDGSSSISALSGSYTWQQTAISRPTPGIPFEFTYAYNSANASSGYPMEDGADAFAPQALGAGWRHSFEARILPTTSFNPTSTRQAIGFMGWDGNIETWDIDTTTPTGGVKFKTRHKEYRGELELIGNVMESNATIRWITPDRLIYTFRTPYPVGPEPLMLGRLNEIADLNGNRILLTYHETGEKAGLIQRVTDTAGGIWNFNYDASNLLTSVTGPSDDIAQKWTLSFSYTTVNNRNTLSSRSLAGPAAYADAVSPPLNTQWQFQYSTSPTDNPSPAGLLKAVIDPRGKNDVRIAYDARGRKTSLTDAINRITSYAYNSPAVRQLTTTVSTRNSVDTFDRKLRRISTKNALNQTLSFEYDEFGNTTATVDPRGTRTTMTYDARSNMLTSTVVPLSQTTTWEYGHTHAYSAIPGGIPGNEPTKVINPLGWATTYAYDGAGNLTSQSDGIGTLVTHTYDTRGLVTSSRDGNNNLTTFAYNGAGFLTSRTIASGTSKSATATLVPNELGWVLSETNALGEAVSHLRNINGQPVRSTDPLGRIFTKAFDANGNLTSESDAKGALTAYAYDDADQRVSMTNRGGSVWTYTYTYWGEPQTTNTPAAVSDGTSRQETSTLVYDNAGRLTESRDTYSNSNGQFIRYEYDANGNRTASVDKAGQRWETTYDQQNRPVTNKDPLGNITTTSYDAAGRVKTITSPNGFPTRHDYDGRGRLTKWTDPMGSDWRYAYDGNANILDIEDAQGGHYVMTYGPANERLTERNQDNQTWNYTYDTLFRLLTHADPNGTTRTLVRDAAGRIERVDFGSGRTNTLQYDENNNPTTVIRAKPGESATFNNLSYDSLDRLISSTDTFGKGVGYTYDALGRVITKTYPGSKVLTHTYDRLNRLTGQSFNFGTAIFNTSFTYNAVSRLVSQTYPNGLTQTNAFDNAGRVTALSHNQGGTALIALTYAYDKNGNKTGGTDQGAITWNPADVTGYDETARFTPAGKLIDRVDSAPAAPKTLSYTYDASGNMTRAATPGDAEVYALAYDEDNRTTGITYTTSLTTKTIANRYDAMGRRVARTADGIQTRYVLDLVGDMERILCDTTSTGSITAWYVHSPSGLSYKVSPSGSITCYHANAEGNIIRTTTTDGTDADTVPDTVNEYAYTGYGRRLVVTGPAGDPYRFVGSQGVMEDLPNLYFMRARYYSAEAAVFLGTDPNKAIAPAWAPCLYRYASNNPYVAFDPTGLFDQWAGIDAGVDWMGGSWGLSAGVKGYDSSLNGEISGPINFEASGGATYGVGYGGSAHVNIVKYSQHQEPDPYKGAISENNAIEVEVCAYLIGGGCLGWGSSGWSASLGFGAGAEVNLSATHSVDYTRQLTPGKDSGKSNTGSSSSSDAGSTSKNKATNPAPQQKTSTQQAAATAKSNNRQQTTPAAKTQVSSNTSTTYVVKPGDTFWGIGQKTGTNYQTLMSANGYNSSTARGLRVGTRITITKSSGKK